MSVHYTKCTSVRKYVLLRSLNGGRMFRGRHGSEVLGSKYVNRPYEELLGLWKGLKTFLFLEQFYWSQAGMFPSRPFICNSVLSVSLSLSYFATDSQTVSQFVLALSPSDFSCWQTIAGWCHGVSSLTGWRVCLATGHKFGCVGNMHV